MKRIAAVAYLIFALSFAAVPFETRAGGPALTKIAYASGGGFRTRELGIILEDGSGAAPLARLGLDCYNPEWSPDGTKLAFTAYRQRGSENAEIAVINADGTGLMWLTDNDVYDAHPSWSPDGGKIVFVSDRDNHSGEIYIMNSDGSDAIRVTTNRDPEFGPAWSPDGSKIAFSTRPALSHFCICVMDPDGNNMKRLTKHAFHEIEPAWSPDGSRIAYCTWEGPNERNPLKFLFGGIRIIDSDGKNPRRLLGTYSGDSSPSWSPDGTRIVFQRAMPLVDFDLLIIYVDGDMDPVNITKTKTPELDPAWCWQ